MFDRDSIVIGQPTTIKLLTKKYPIYDLGSNLIGYLVAQQKAVPYYFENQLGVRLSEVKMEGRYGVAEKIVILDPLNQIRGIFKGGGTMQNFRRMKTRFPCTLENALGQIIGISDSFQYHINDGSYNGVRKCGFSVKDASGNVIAKVHGVSNHDGVQVDFLAHQIDRLAILNFIAVIIA